MPDKGRTSTKLKCRSCGTIMRKSIKAIKITEQGKKKRNIIILEHEMSSLPITNKNCVKCNSKKAYWWMQQTKDDDEAPTQFFRCTKCKKVWREDK